MSEGRSTDGSRRRRRRHVAPPAARRRRFRLLPVPVLKPPPCNHTITGLRPWSRKPVVQRFSRRQSSSSDCGLAHDLIRPPSEPADLRAFRTVVERVTHAPPGCRTRRRLEPEAHRRCAIWHALEGQDRPRNEVRAPVRLPSGRPRPREAAPRPARRLDRGQARNPAAEPSTRRPRGVGNRDDPSNRRPSRACRPPAGFRCPFCAHARALDMLPSHIIS